MKRRALQVSKLVETIGLEQKKFADRARALAELDARLDAEREARESANRARDAEQKRRRKQLDEERAASQRQWPRARAHVWIEERQRIEPDYRGEPEDYIAEWRQGKEEYQKRLLEFAAFINSNEPPLLPAARATWSAQDYFEQERRRMPLPNDSLESWPEMEAYVKSALKNIGLLGGSSVVGGSGGVAPNSDGGRELAKLAEQAMFHVRAMHWHAIAASGALLQFRQRYDELRGLPTPFECRAKRSRREAFEQRFDYNYLVPTMSLEQLAIAQRPEWPDATAAEQ